MYRSYSAAAAWQRFRGNLESFLVRHRLLVTVYCLAIVGDGVSTAVFMSEHGPSTEIHPGVRLTCVMAGPVFGAALSVLGKLVGAGMVVALLGRWAHWPLLGATVMSLFAAWYNIHGGYVWVPGFLAWLP